MIFCCCFLGTCLIMVRLDQRVPQPCLQLCHQLRFELNYPMFFKKEKKKIVKSWKNREIVKKNREIRKKSWNHEKKFYETSAWQIAQSWWLDTQLFKQNKTARASLRSKNRADTPQWSQILFKVAYLIFIFLQF